MLPKIGKDGFSIRERGGDGGGDGRSVASRVSKAKSVSGQSRRSSTRNAIQYDFTQYVRYLNGEPGYATQASRAHECRQKHKSLTSDIERTNSEKKEQYREIVAEHVANVENSHDLSMKFRRGLRTPVYPEFANNFISKDICLVIYPNNNGVIANLKNDPFGVLTPLIQPSAAEYFFSKDKYMQGDCPSVDTASGSLDNTYVVELNLDHFRNPYPVPIGLTLMHGERVLGEQNAVFHDRVFHAILPPAHQHSYSESKGIYMTTDTVNLDIAQEFPDLVANMDKIKKGVLAIEDGMVTIPIHHPITRWLFNQCSYYKGMDPPVAFQVNGKAITRVSVKESAMTFAAHQLYQTISDRVPIIDLRKLKIQLQLLDSRLFEQDVVAHFHRVIDSHSLSSAKTYDVKGVTLCFSMIYMFKGHYDGQATVRKDGRGGGGGGGGGEASDGSDGGGLSGVDEEEEGDFGDYGYS